ncbi:MAG: PAS domain S-box protein [Bacteroidetes bacterium]|nr:PAS domain S-box protein [Bacteroidota bacterium]
MEELEIHDRYKFFSGIAATIVIGLGMFVLAGWQFDVGFFKRPFPNLVAMNPTTALCFIASGISTLLIVTNKSMHNTNMYVLLFAAVPFIIGILKVFTLVWGVDLRIDSLLFAEKIKNDVIGNLSNRMAPNTAFNFMICGTALLLINYETKEKHMPAQYLALIVALVGLLSVLGYLYRVQAFYGVLTYIPMAIHTAIGFLFISLAILFTNPDRGIMKVITGSYAGSSTLRFLIPAAIIIPIILGYFRLIGEWEGLFGMEFGVAILVLSIIIVFMCLIWYNGVSLNKRDILRKLAENNLLKLNMELEARVIERTKEFQNSERKFRALIENNYDAIVLNDSDGIPLYQSPSVEKMLGWSLNERENKNGTELMHPDDVENVRIKMKEALEHPGKPIHSSHRIKHKQGHYIWTEGTITNMLHEPSIGALVSNFRDITDRKLAESELKEKAIYTSKRSCDLLEVLLKYSMMDFSQRIPVSEKGDEWDAIAIGLNTLSEELESHIKQVQDANRQLVAVNNELESFSYSVSHDLRAPLRAVNGYAQVLNEDYSAVLNKEGKRLIETIQYNATKMGTLIDDLLSFSRLGRKEVQRSAINMNDLAEGLIIELNKTVKYNAKIEYGKLHTVTGDYGLIYRVMFNLVSNAVKYSSKNDNARIEISSEQNKDETVFFIKDNGVGFDMRYSGKLFGVFQRLHTSEEFEGTGVGLAIVQRIISKHGGRVGAEGYLNKGATFYFALPNN